MPLSDPHLQPRREESSGAPAWVMTFADLMSLLMCFFVLMLAFSEMDVQRFKLLSGSMRDAFGVQAEIQAKVLPKGTSLITKEFAPGKPQPTPLKTVRQFTTQSNANTLKWADEREADAKHMRKMLQQEIDENAVTVEVDGTRIIIRIRDRASFASGSAQLKPDFKPVLAKIRALLAEVEGEITVAGHTDNVPIANARFRSNWELSASRAVSVAHELLNDGALGAERFAVAGHADTLPVATNVTAAGRAENRRVDISIARAVDETADSETLYSASEDAQNEVTP